MKQGFKLGPRARKVLTASSFCFFIGVLAFFAAWYRIEMLEDGEFLTYDRRATALVENDRRSEEIVVIKINDVDLMNVEENLGLSWPWPRPLYGEIIRYVSGGGAKAVFIDLLFEDRKGLADDIDEFAEAVSQSERTVLGMVTRKLDKNPKEKIHRPKAGPRLVAAMGALPAEADEDKAQANARRWATRLLVWKTRAFVVATNPPVIYFGGTATQDQLFQTWARLTESGDFKSLLSEDELPVSTELTAEIEATEITDELIATEKLRTIDHSDDVTLYQRKFIPPLAMLVEAAAGLANVMQRADFDGVVRRHAYFVKTTGGLMPSPAMAMYMVAHPDAKVRVESDSILIDERKIPIDEEARATLRFYDDGASYEPFVSAYPVLRSIQQIAEGEKPEISSSLFKDKYVIVSAAAEGLRDIRYSPVATSHEGALINALALDNLIHDDFITRLSRRGDAIITLVFSTLAGILIVLVSTLSRRPLLGLFLNLISAVMLLGGYALLSYKFLESGTWIPLFLPTVAAATSMLGGMLFVSTLERRDRRFVQEALGRYTSPALVEELVRHPEHLALEWGEERKLSVYFSDIAGFTSISEALTAKELVSLLNEYLTEMTDIVLRHGGVVDKYIGDAIMAFWGAPVRDPKHEKNSVLAAIDMRDRCTELRKHWLEDYGHRVYARAGVNSGLAVIGNMGSEHKYNYTVMGDMVNLASRLEGANKPYKTDIMISESTMLAVADCIEARELDSIAVKGKLEPARVYEVIGRKGEIPPESLMHVAPFEEALDLYRKSKFNEAIVFLEKALVASPNDGPSAIFLERCKVFVASPPPDEWDGVWRMKEK